MNLTKLPNCCERGMIILGGENNDHPIDILGLSFEKTRKS